jgi:DNA invertase Pin-like site-specific DNA recombinase
LHRVYPKRTIFILHYNKYKAVATFERCTGWRGYPEQHPPLSNFLFVPLNTKSIFIRFKKISKIQKRLDKLKRTVYNKEKIGGKNYMNGIKIGIGRVSTDEQNPQRQIDAFLQEGIEERYVFIDSCTGNGGNLDKRENYQKAKAIVRKGDVVFFDSLDRLGRKAREIETEWRYFTEEVGCDIVVMNMPILDTRKRVEGDMMGEMVSEIVLKIVSYIAENETQERARRQRGGIEAAKAAGKYKGKPPKKIDKELFEKLYNEVKNKERTVNYAIKQIGVKRTTWYVLVNEYETQTGRFE